MEFIFYNPSKLKAQLDAETARKLRLFFHLFDLINNSVMFLDRTGCLLSPVRSKNLFPLGDHSRDRGVGYAEICVNRARELLRVGEKLQKPLGVFWSGGIDSTVILVALKMAEETGAPLRDRVHVFLSPESIREYPDFYKKHIRDHLRILPSHAYSDYFQGQYVLVNGEGNDQLFGSQLISSIPASLGPDFLWRSPSRENIRSYLSCFPIPENAADALAARFELLIARCPSGIDSIFEFLWWVNFTCKWQSVFIRMLGYLHPAGRSLLSAKFVAEHYHAFFMTSEFENWSIWKKDQKIRKELKSYKTKAKEFIYDFTGDLEYLEHKLKVGSLSRVIRYGHSVSGITDDFRFIDGPLPADIFLSSHSFQPT